jgi:hypothetical protein
MKHTCKFFIIIAALIAMHTASAQNIVTATIQWNCISTFKVQPGTIVDEPTKVTSSPQQIVWYGSDGNVVHTLSITDTAGSWTNVASNGAILFNVSNASGNTGIVQFSKNANDIRIRLHIVVDQDSEIYDLTVSNLTTL